MSLVLSRAGRPRASRPVPDDAASRPGVAAGTDARVAAWRANIGSPVVADTAPALAAPPAAIHVICWNLAVGRARLDLLLDRLGERYGIGRADGPPFVLLLQEAYRADGSVPRRAVTPAHGGAIQPARPDDIVDAAIRHGLSLRYVPSMRNGRSASDRGNAILSNVAIADHRLLPLPVARQHRVGVAVTLQGLADVWFASAHLDVGGAAPDGPARWRFGAGRAAQARALAAQLVDHARDGCVVVGGDLNTHAGRFDPAFRELLRHGFHAPARTDGGGHTFHGPVRLALDHLLLRSTTRRARVLELERIGPCGAWPRARVLGSDHHPLAAIVEIARRDAAALASAAVTRTTATAASS